MNERESNEQVHQAAPSGDAPSAGLTSQTASGNTAASTEVDAPSRLSIRRNGAGEVDEVFAQGAELHIEQMNDGHWWMGITDATGEFWHINFSTKRNTRINCFIESDGVRPIQPQGAASPQGAMLDVEAAKPLASSGQDHPASAALAASLPALLLQAVEALEVMHRAREWMAEHETAIFAASESAWKQMTLIAADLRAAEPELAAALQRVSNG